MQMFDGEKMFNLYNIHKYVRCQILFFCLHTFRIHYRNNVDCGIFNNFFLVIHHNFQNKQNMNKGTDDW